MNKFLYWLPRVLGIASVVLLFSLSLDVFSQSTNTWQAIAAFFIHSIPALIMLIALIVAWRYPKLGGISLIVLSLILAGYIINASRDRIAVDKIILNDIIVAGPFTLTGILFFIRQEAQKQKINPNSSPTPR